MSLYIKKEFGEFVQIPFIKGEKGEAGTTPHIGDNGNWFIGDTDTGKPSRGEDGVKTVNGIAPDENGNVEIKIPESSGSSVTIDPTLTQSGQAADAKAVGDAIANLDIPSIDGLATEEYVDTAIANVDNPIKELYRATLESDAVVTITETADGIPFIELALTKFKIVLRCPKIQTNLSCYLYAVIGNSSVQLSPYEVVANTSDNVINIIDGIKFTDETWEFTRIRSKYYGDTPKAVVANGAVFTRTVLDNMPGNFTKFATNPELPAGTEVVIYGA